MFDLLRLRPSAPTAAALRTALADAETALAANATEQANAKQARDAALLDASPSELTKLEASYAGARESHERIVAVVDQLRIRHAAAERAEATAGVEGARKNAEAAVAAHAAWWAKSKKRLAETLSEGMRLQTASSEMYGDWQRAAMRVREAYPELTFEPPTGNPEDPGLWMVELRDAAIQEDFSHLATFPRSPATVVTFDAPPPSQPVRPASRPEYQHGHSLAPSQVPDRAPG